MIGLCLDELRSLSEQIGEEPFRGQQLFDWIYRKNIDDYTKYVSIYGARGLAYIRVNDLSKGMEGLQSPILKFLPDEVVSAILDRVDAKDNDIIFFGADRTSVVNDALGALRGKLAEDLDLYQRDWAACWVTVFPMFESTDDGGWTAIHHPFTAPSCDIESMEAGRDRPFLEHMTL